MFRTLSSFPCTLCSRRLVDTIKAHHDGCIKYKRAQALQYEMKNHLYKSSETHHQLDKCVLRKILQSTEARTYFHK